METVDIKERKIKKIWKKKKMILGILIISLLILFPVLLIVDNEFAKNNTLIENISDIDERLNIGTFNIHLYWDKEDQIDNLNKLIDLIKTEEIEIIGFQEMWLDNISYLSQELNMYYFNNSQTHQNTFHGLALLSKYPILENNFLVLNNSQINGIRAIIWAKIAYKNENITVYVTHLDTPATYFSQLNQVKQILNIINDKTKFLLFCDCNAPDTLFLESYRLLTENFEDGWIASGKNTFEGRTWPSNSPFLRVDYVWLSKNDWSVQRGSGKTIGNTSYSDHLGVRVTVKIN